MASKPLSKGQQNFTQLAIACVEVITQVFNDCLDSQISPKDLYNAIKSCSKLTNGKDKLNQYQLKICCISPPQVPDYGKFDVSLFYKLMRNLCLTFKPTTGWGNTPNTSDLQIGDDIERLRIFRNDMFAHLESSEVPDFIFLQCWKELKGCVCRAQSFLDSLGYGANYDEQLKNIENLDLSCKDMDKYRLFLEETMFMWRLSQNIDVPVIKMTGYCDVFCGEETCFEAKTDNCPKSNNWPIVWERVRGSVTETIDKSAKKYEGSTTRRLVIRRVVKEDEGEYRAVISRELHGSHINVPSNTLFLNALGDHPSLEITQATSGIDGVTILYDIEETRPVIEKIKWTKDGEPLSMDAIKYQGGGVSDRYLKILSPSENDGGEYICRVFNAVGSDMKRIVLAVPSVVICKELTVPLGGQATIIPDITSCPSPKKALWLKSESQAPENFLTVDIDDARYFGSSMDPEKPILVISNVSYIDNLHYRLEITNGFGKSTSNAVLLKLVGDIPSVSANLETNIEDRRVTFNCKISLSDNYPEVTEIIWIKDKQYIDASSSGGKYTGGSKTDPPLVLHGVNSNDIGQYQCRVSNAAGSMFSDIIYLGKPTVQMGRPERDEKNDILVCKATIASIPEAIKAEWRIQQSEEDDFQPIDIHESTYRGSTVSLPHPVLIVHGYSNKRGQRFQISVSNFVGETREVILGKSDRKRKNEGHDREKHDKRMKFYRKGGSKIPFASLKDDLDSSFPNKKLKRLKQLLIDQEEIEEDSVFACNSLWDILNILIQRDLFSRNDVIFVQYLLRTIGCLDLYETCYKYAKDCEALCFFESQPENGCKNVKFHIDGNIEEYSKEDILFIQITVAKMLKCPTDYIVISGLERDTSFLLILSIKDEYTTLLLEHGQQILEDLSFLKVDYIEYDEILIHKENISQVSAIRTVMDFDFGVSVKHKMRENSPETTCIGGDVKNVEERMAMSMTMEEPALGSSDQNWDSGLVTACKKGYAGVVKKILNTGVDVNLPDVTGYTPLLAACMGRDDIIVGDLLHAGADVNFQDKRGYTPLIIACENGHVNIVKKLLIASADVNLSDFRGNTPLVITCMDNHVDIVDELVKAGAEVNGMKESNILPKSAVTVIDEQNIDKHMQTGTRVLYHPLYEDYYTPLVAASMFGHHSIVKKLVKAGADVNLQNKIGETPLLMTCKNGHESIMEDLLKAGADVNLPDKTGCTPLLAACMSRDEILATGANSVNIFFATGRTQPEVNYMKRGSIARLLQTGAIVNMQDKSGNTPLAEACLNRRFDIVKELVNVGADVNLESNKGTPLVIACEVGHSSVVQTLLEAGACVNLTGRTRPTPLAVACMRGKQDIVDKLIKSGADVNLQINGDLPLMVACNKRHLSIMEKLLNAGAEVNLMDKDKNTPLMKACFHREKKIVKELIKAGADVNLHNIIGETPLITACKTGDFKIVKDLLRAGAVVNMPDHKGNVPLLTASEFRFPDIFEELLKKGADINALDKKGNTVLTRSCLAGEVGAVDKLLKAGAKVGIPNKKGKTPLAIACESGHVNIVKELIKIGADVNLQISNRNSPLVAAFEGQRELIKDFEKAVADVNVQSKDKDLPRCIAVIWDKSPLIQILMKYGAHYPIYDKYGLSPLLNALCKKQTELIEDIIKTGNRRFLNSGNLNLFNILVEIRNANMKTDAKDDVKATKRGELSMDKFEDIWKTISEGDCDTLRGLLSVGLDVNQRIKLYGFFTDPVRPLLHTLIEEPDIKERVEKVKILLEAGSDINTIVKCYKNKNTSKSKLDREGLSVLEMTQRLVNRYGNSKDTQERNIGFEYRRVLCEIKKHVRRYSV